MIRRTWAACFLPRGFRTGGLRQFSAALWIRVKSWAPLLSGIFGRLNNAYLHEMCRIPHELTEPPQDRNFARIQNVVNRLDRRHRYCVPEWEAIPEPAGCDSAE